MRIKNIKIGNFLSFEESSISLAESIDEKPAIYIIDGLNLDTDSNDDASNGSGKSTLISESIMYNIYGRALRGSKQKLKLNDMIRHGCSKMFNEVEYFIKTDDGISELTIARSKDVNGSSTTSVSIDGDAKTKRTKRLSDKDIATFINIEPDIFTQVITYYRDNLNLLAMNYGQRLEFFKNIIDLSIIDKYYDSAKMFKTNNEKALYQLEIKQKSAKEILEVISKDKNKYDDFILKRIDELTEQLNIYVNEKIEDISQYKEAKNKLVDIINDNTKSLNDITGKIAYENRSISTIKDEINKITRLSGGNCPMCKQSVPIEHTDRILAGYNSELENINNNIKSLNSNQENYSQAIVAARNRYDLVENKINEATTAEIIRNNKISSLKNEIDKLNKELIRQKEEDSKEEKVDKEIYEKKYQGLTNAVDIRNKWQESAEYWYNIFSPKSLLRSTIIKKYITILSDMFEYYVSALYENEITGNILINEEGQIDIILFKDNFETNYWQMSSGEKKRVDIALILALYEFTSYLNPNIPKFMIFDEIFSSLDEAGKASTMSVLIEMQKRHSIDIYLISHESIPLDETADDLNIKHILVTKKDKVSTVKKIEN